MGRTRKRGAAAPWARRRRRVLLALALLVLLLSPALVWRIRLRSDVLQRFSDLREKGLPVTGAEFVAWEPHAPDEAAADAAFEQVFRTYKDMGAAQRAAASRLGGREPGMLEVPFSVATRASLEQRVAGNEEMLRHLRDASNFTSYRTVRDTEAVSRMDMRSLKLPLDVLFAEACLLAEQGQGDAAMDAIMAGIRAARACRASPFNDAFNVAIGCEIAIGSAIYPVAARADVSDAKWDAFLTLVREDDWLDDLERSIIGSRCFSLHPLGRIGDPGDAIELLLGTRDVHDREVLRFSEEVTALAQLPHQQWSDYLRSRGISDRQHYFWWGEAPAKSIETTAIAVLRYRQRHGDFPPSLESLVPDLLDEVPSDGAGLAQKLWHDAEFLKIYEVGPDGKDDGGDEARDILVISLPLSGGA